ncbi:MAG: GDSL-type esterase/lipase family protein [Bacteroidota bacterium]
MKYLLYISLTLNLLAIFAGIFALQKFGGLQQIWKKATNQGAAESYEHFKNLLEVLPPKENAIVFLGNSLTAANEWSEMMANPSIVNRGIPGDHCDGVLARLETLTRLNPKMIFLEIGVNDLLFHSPDTVLKKYEQLVEGILVEFPNAELHLQSLFPVNNQVRKVGTTNAQIRLLNEGIRQLAKAKGLTFIDLYPLLLDREGNLDAAYTLDGIHLNGQAYLKWKEKLEGVIGN